jgi:hypothetical protein
MKALLQYIILSCIAAMVFFTSCLQKQVDIKLPPFKSQLVVECYLEKNVPVRVAVSQTSNFFAAPDLSAIFLRTAKVILSYGNTTDTLVYNTLPDFKHRQWFNYQLKNADTIAFKSGVTYYLKVIDSTGRTVTAQTTWFDPVQIDSVKELINPVNSTRIDTTMKAYFKDPVQVDYYRFRAINHTKLDSVRQDFFFQDYLFNGQTFGLSTGRKFHKGDTCDITLYHIDNDYFTFLNTSRDADNANGNPFASPAAIISNIKGGVGIFTVLPQSNNRVVFK